MAGQVLFNYEQAVGVFEVQRGNYPFKEAAGEGRFDGGELYVFALD